MPRTSTIVILLSTVVLYALGLSAVVPAGLVLAMACEAVAWKRAADQANQLRLARIVRPTRHLRGRR